jgi:hypothetical protein
MRKKRPYVPGEWKRRARVDPRSKSRKVGRPRKCFAWVDDYAERQRMHRRVRDEDPVRVARNWRHETQTRSKAEVLAAEAVCRYAEWFESLDSDESAMDGAL